MIDNKTYANAAAILVDVITSSEYKEIMTSNYNRFKRTKLIEKLTSRELLKNGVFTKFTGSILFNTRKLVQCSEVECRKYLGL